MDKKRFGQYVTFNEEPDDDKGKAEYVKQAVSYVLDELLGNGIVPKWETLEMIVKEGYDFISDDPDWYAEEKEGYQGPRFGWQMTVALKCWSDNYKE